MSFPVYLSLSITLLCQSQTSIFIFSIKISLISCLITKKRQSRACCHLMLFFVLLFRIPARVKATKKGNNIQTTLDKNKDCSCSTQTHTKYLTIKTIVCQGAFNTTLSCLFFSIQLKCVWYYSFFYINKITILLLRATF